MTLDDLIAIASENVLGKRYPPIRTLYTTDEWLVKLRTHFDAAPPPGDVSERFFDLPILVSEHPERDAKNGDLVLTNDGLLFVKHVPTSEPMSPHR